MTENEFLSNYDKRQFDSPLMSIDAAMFSFHQGALCVLLVKRSNHPEKGKWALPGGFVDEAKDQTLEDTVRRKLQEKTGVTPPYLDQLQTVGNSTRDKRGWSVTVCYTALMSYQACQSHIETVDDVRWVAFDEAVQKDLAFDHAVILGNARERLRQKALYSIVPAYALPKRFTFPELQHVHEVLIGKELQKKSFRRRIEQAELLIDTGEKRADGGRPAILYEMKEDSADFTFVRNLEQ